MSKFYPCYISVELTHNVVFSAEEPQYSLEATRGSSARASLLSVPATTSGSRITTDVSDISSHHSSYKETSNTGDSGWSADISSDGEFPVRQKLQLYTQQQLKKSAKQVLATTNGGEFKHPLPPKQKQLASSTSDICAPENSPYSTDAGGNQQQRQSAPQPLLSASSTDSIPKKPPRNQKAKTKPSPSAAQSSESVLPPKHPTSQGKTRAQLRRVSVQRSTSLRPPVLGGELKLATQGIKETHSDPSFSDSSTTSRRKTENLSDDYLNFREEVEKHMGDLSFKNPIDELNLEVGDKKKKPNLLRRIKNLGKHLRTRSTRAKTSSGTSEND